MQQQRMVVEQLRREASIKRISVSQAIEDIKVIFATTIYKYVGTDLATYRKSLGGNILNPIKYSC